MKRMLIVIILVIFCSGCASPARRTGYLNNYEIMYRGKYLENYWANTSLIKEKQYSTIVISAINVDRIANQKNVTTEDCRKWMTNALKNATQHLEDHFIFKSNSNSAQAKLEISITEMTPGSGTARMFAGEFGMGHAWVQVEGRIIDLKSGEKIAMFSDRRRSSGAIGLADIGGDVGADLVARMLEQIGTDLIKELEKSFNFP